MMNVFRRMLIVLTVLLCLCGTALAEFDDMEDLAADPAYGD